MISGYVSIKQIFGVVYRNIGINYDVSESDMYEWGAEALSLIGAYSQYDEVSKCIDLKDGKAALPLGFHKLVDINYNKSPVYWATNTNAHNYQCKDCNISVCSDRINQKTFYINDNYLITNIDGEENVCMVMLKMHTDDEGYPMVPDDPYYSKAVSSYIIHMIDTISWRKGNLPDKVYAKSEQDWLFYVNSARGSANMPNVAQLENLKNITTRLMPLKNEYSKNFVNTTNPERLNIR